MLPSGVFSSVTAGTTFLFLNYTLLSANRHAFFVILHKTILLVENTPVGSLVWRYENQKTLTFLLLPPQMLWPARAARQNFSFSLGFFFWNVLRTKLEALLISGLSLVWRGCPVIIKKALLPSRFTQQYNGAATSEDFDSSKDTQSYTFWNRRRRPEAHSQ